MRVCGVIAEYNPFHNGHKYQLQQARALCDYLVVCMAGGMTQRGEVALLDKWTRARMALENGADAVIELPALLAVRPAEAFARGGVLTLTGLGIDVLSFGCETADVSLLRRVAQALSREDDALSDATRRALNEGKSHARARGEAVERLMNLPEGFLNRPNTALALEYLRALAEAGSGVEAFPVLRRGDYHDEALGEFASATAIRRAALRGEREAIAQAMPRGCFDALAACLDAGRFADMASLDQALILALRTASPANLASLCDVSEGMERLFIKHAGEAGTREALLDRVKCKRYTHARLSRFCAHALLGLTRAAAQAHPVPEYARVLGFRQDAAPLLRHFKEKGALPLVTDATRLRHSEMFRFDCAATDLQALAQINPAGRAAGQDFTREIVIV